MSKLSERLTLFNAALLPDMVKLKYEAMAENLFRYFRGTCHLFYEDLAAAKPLPLSPLAWICGDLHLENFGSFRGENGLVYFDLNDFDEALLAPAAYEVVRLVTSIFIAFDTLKIEPERALNMAQLFVKTYCQTLANVKAINIDPRIAKGILADFLKSASKHSEKDVLKKRTVSKKKKIMLSLEDERHFKLPKELRKNLSNHINQWISTSSDGPYNYQVIGAVFRLAGTGSIGVKRYLFLLKSTNFKGKYLLLDMKQSRASSVEPFVQVQQLGWATNAERITAIQHRMQHVTAALLSTTIFENEPYVMQELQPVKDGIKFKLLTDDYRGMYQVISDMGALTASAQLRSSGMQGSGNIDDLCAFGKDEGWQDEVVEYALQYARQIKKDYRQYLRDYKKAFFNLKQNPKQLKTNKRIAILGGGPSGLFTFKRLVESGINNLRIDIFEKRQRLGVGMPYSRAGANDEHVTNVSGNEIPLIVTPIAEWIKTVPAETLSHFGINEKFNDYKVLPRLLFGQYLAAQFNLLLVIAKEKGIETKVHFGSVVTNVVDHGDHLSIEVAESSYFEFDQVIICTGHHWPLKDEDKVPGYFDSPYPPSKLKQTFNHPVAIKGSSLTAVDAVKTLARHHGAFLDQNDKKTYQLSKDYPDFKMILHTRNGMLPAVRFHLENSHLENDALLTRDEINTHIAANDGFLSLDYLFENDFKAIFRNREPEFYAHIKNMSVEEFVANMMDLRESLDPFILLKAEYAEAEKSIKRRASVYWKEMLGVLSFAMNYPAKHLSAEDMQRLQKALLPLISIVIAYIPQSSTEELLALHEAGLLEIVSVGDDSRVEAQPTGGAVYYYDHQAVYFKTFIDCVGQPHLDYKEFPFKGLIKNNTIAPAMLRFRSAAEGLKAQDAGQPVVIGPGGDYYLHVSGIAINDSFQVLDAYGAYNERIYIMAVPYIGGYNPDYSGLDFCEEASEAIINSILKNERATA